MRVKSRVGAVATEVKTHLERTARLTVAMTLRFVLKRERKAKCVPQKASPFFCHSHHVGRGGRHACAPFWASPTSRAKCHVESGLIS